MTDFDAPLRSLVARRRRTSKVRLAFLVLIPVAAILFQVYVPRFLKTLSYLELPLLVTVYFALLRRDQVAGALIGCGVGLAQDALTHHLFGTFGLVKTLVGYFAASVSQRFDVQNSALRFILSFLFFLFHQLLYWVLARALLRQMVELNAAQTVIFAFLNAVVSIPLFLVLDRLREEGR